MAGQLKEVFDRSFKISQSQCALLLGCRSARVSSLILDTANQYNASILTLSCLLLSDDLQALQSLAIQISVLTNAEYTDCNFQSTLLYIRKTLRPQHKLVISIYDIQELAHKNLKQILLYTLLELVHEDLCMMCVIGITNRLDFIEMLEKRIKSRFSYQCIMMLDSEILENTLEGIKIEDYSLAAIKQLKPIHMTVLISYLKLSNKTKELTTVAAYKEYTTFKSTSPMIVYEIDKFTFSIITNYLIKYNLITLKKPHVIQRFSIYSLNFDPSVLTFSIKNDSLELPTALHEWVASS